MPRVKSFNKEEALKKAMELFWEKGYAATSLSDLTTHLGIGKGSFYATFNSKQALFEAAFDLYRNSKVELLEQLLNSEPNIKIGLRKLLNFNIEELLSDHKHKGCFITNTCSEFSGTNEILKGKLEEHYNIFQQVLVNYLRRGKVSPKKAESVAATIITFLMGMSQQTKFKRDKKSYLGSIKHLVGLLD
ncbi:MAG: TetR/AcrR family transcriptional regulator [Saprospiraceae bacterium]